MLVPKLGQQEIGKQERYNAMSENKNIERPIIVPEDYIHSANSLFHFVSSSNYLIEALQLCALSPRYCVEDVKYLNIVMDGEAINEVAVLQKCFCDIPLQNVFKKFPVRLTENNATLSAEQKNVIPTELSHPQLYGKYAIALSKRWGERNNVQPVQYMAEGSNATSGFTRSLITAIGEENLPDDISNTMINRKLHAANLLINAVLKNVEEMENGNLKIKYGDTEDKPMYISYKAFMTEEEAKKELENVIDHKEEYEKAKTAAAHWSDKDAYKIV